MTENEKASKDPQPEAGSDVPPAGGSDATTHPGEGEGGPAGPDGSDAHAEVATLRAELDETKDRLLRALAEMENLRRRGEREVEDAKKYALTSFARELLDVSDNLSRALASVPPAEREQTPLLKTLTEGVAMTERSLHGLFERRQIAKVEPALGDKFDHNRHQAMFEVESDEQSPGTIAQVVQPGYVIADRLLRPAMVGVAKAKPAPAPTSGSGAAAGGTPEDGAEPRPGERLDTTV